MEDILIPIVVMGTLFIGLPWLILHYTTKWRSSATLTTEDENLLDELYDTARRLEDRLHTIERIVAADNPDWRPAVRVDDEDDRIEFQSERRIFDRSN
jgi:phage shock protein B